MVNIKQYIHLFIHLFIYYYLKNRFEDLKNQGKISTVQSICAVQDTSKRPYCISQNDFCAYNDTNCASLDYIQKDNQQNPVRIQYCSYHQACIGDDAFNQLTNHTKTIFQEKNISGSCQSKNATHNCLTLGIGTPTGNYLNNRLLKKIQCDLNDALSFNRAQKLIGAPVDPKPIPSTDSMGPAACIEETSNLYRDLQLLKPDIFGKYNCEYYPEDGTSKCYTKSNKDCSDCVKADITDIDITLYQKPCTQTPSQAFECVEEFPKQYTEYFEKHFNETSKFNSTQNAFCQKGSQPANWCIKRGKCLTGCKLNDAISNDAQTGIPYGFCTPKNTTDEDTLGLCLNKLNPTLASKLKADTTFAPYEKYLSCHSNTTIVEASFSGICLTTYCPPSQQNECVQTDIVNSVNNQTLFMQKCTNPIDPLFDRGYDICSTPCTNRLCQMTTHILPNPTNWPNIQVGTFNNTISQVTKVRFFLALF